MTITLTTDELERVTGYKTPNPQPTASLRPISNQRTVSYDLPVQQHYFGVK